MGGRIWAWSLRRILTGYTVFGGAVLLVSRPQRHLGGNTDSSSWCASCAVLPLPGSSLRSTPHCCCPTLTSVTDWGYLTPLEQRNSFHLGFFCFFLVRRFSTALKPDKPLLLICLNRSGTDTKGGANNPARRHRHRTARRRRHAGPPGNLPEEFAKKKLSFMYRHTETAH